MSIEAETVLAIAGRKQKMSTNEKQLYLCLLVFQSEANTEPFKFMSAPVATSEEEAKLIAVNEARSEWPEYASSEPSEINAYSFKRSKVEQAAREILGWGPPPES